MKPMKVWLRSSVFKSLIEVYVSGKKPGSGARDAFDFVCREYAKLIWERLPKPRSKEVLEATITGKIIEKKSIKRPA